jgi:DNA repair protein RecN (Recombination protein N)
MRCNPLRLRIVPLPILAPMLRELKISNLALVEELHINLPTGLVVLTGETGAGKSIILQAIHLLSGGKISGNWIRTGADTASVEALFEISPRHLSLREELQEAGFEAEDEIILRRVLAGGKSRFFINGSLATAKFVGEIAENLLSVASQHDHQQLLNPRSHLDFIDAIGGHFPARQQLGAAYDQWQEARSRVQNLQQLERDKEQRRDFLSFQAREIRDAAILPGEDEILASRKERLKAADTLMRLGREAYELLNEAITEKLSQARKNLEQMAVLDPEISAVSEKISGHAFELEDHLAAIRNYVEDVPDDPDELDRLNGRIDLLQRLRRKYGPSLAEVIEHGLQANKELENLENMEEQLAELNRALAAAERDLTTKSQTLSAARRLTARELATTISREIGGLCLEQARFEIGFQKNEAPDISHLTRTGWDQPQFLFSANPGEPLRPLAQIASGGELSRLMLALKCVLAQKDKVETVIFDEVDAGISGKAAEAVARKIKELADHHQVLCITHLPQIASCAGEHFLVAKSVNDQRTRTEITRLSSDARIHELARMLDGDSATPQTTAYARELLARNQQQP